MSKAQDYRIKAGECAELAKKATSLKGIRQFRQLERSYATLAENEEFLTPDSDKLVSE